MHVVFFCAHPDVHYTDRSGAGTHIRGVVDGFENLGHTVEFLMAAAPPAEQEKRTASAERRSSHFIRNQLPRCWQTLRDVRVLKSVTTSNRRLSNRISQGGVDLVYERGTYLQGSSPSISATRGVPHVIEYNSPLTEERRELSGPSFLDWLGMRRERRLVTTATAIVTVATPLVTYLQNTFARVSSVVVAPNAADTSWAEHRQRSPTRATTQIGFVGSMLSWHRLDLLIDAFAVVVSSGINATLVLVGDGPALQAAIRQAEKAGIEKRIRATGHVSQAEAHAEMLDLDIGVLPGNKWYGSPTKLVEYAAAGIAIVAPDEPGTRDVFTDRFNALLVRPDVEALGTALSELCGSPELRSELGQEARLVAESWTWSDVVERTLSAVPSIGMTGTEKR